MTYVGFSSLHPRTLADDASNLPAYLDLLISPTWPRQPQRLSLIQGPAARRPGRLAKDELIPVVSAMLLHPDVTEVGLEAKSPTHEAGIGIWVTTREFGGKPAVTFGTYPTPDDPTTIEPWLDHVLTFFDRTRTPQAVVYDLPFRGALMEGSFVGIQVDGVYQHPWPEQFMRMRRAQTECTLGTTYVRYPRWGTLYSHAHVAALGGVPAIERAVAPAVIRELGGGVYVQLTPSIATAASEDAYAKQAAFTALATPLLPPPIE